MVSRILYFAGESNANDSRVPTIAWQFLWNYVFGPYLLWNIRMIKDIYHWRLQTTLAIIAGYASPILMEAM